jgi:hypothetical protein
METECSYCGRVITGDSHFASDDAYGEAPCCSPECALELAAVSYFENAGVDLPDDASGPLAS